MYPVYDVPRLATRLFLSLQTGYILNGVHVYGTRIFVVLAVINLSMQPSQPGSDVRCARREGESP